ncbi:MAG TPA: amino acid ABC transporter permease [Chloroflexota bacterium]|nr:amino acid ABC transporter permease [Chloroflexota bacterium]
MSYQFQPGFILEKLPELAAGLELTLLVSTIGMAGSVVLGLLIAAGSSERLPVLDGLGRGYVEVFRNTPLLVQIFFLYFALPEVGIKLQAFTVAWLALVLWGAAYQAENFRAGLEAVSRGYREAARALGFGRPLTFAQVVVPIGFRTALPSVTNVCISILKNSSYMVAISFAELTDTAVDIVSLTFRVFEMFLVIGIIYLGIAWLMGCGLGAVESRLALGEAR